MHIPRCCWRGRRRRRNVHLHVGLRSRDLPHVCRRLCDNGRRSLAAKRCRHRACTAQASRHNAPQWTRAGTSWTNPQTEALGPSSTMSTLCCPTSQESASREAIQGILRQRSAAQSTALLHRVPHAAAYGTPDGFELAPSFTEHAAASQSRAPAARGVASKCNIRRPISAASLCLSGHGAARVSTVDRETLSEPHEPPWPRVATSSIRGQARRLFGRARELRGRCPPPIAQVAAYRPIAEVAAHQRRVGHRTQRRT